MNKEIVQIRSDIGKMSLEFKKVLPPEIPVERFIRCIYTQFMRVEKLQLCTPESILAACMSAAETRLVPDGRLGALVPFWNKDKQANEAQFMSMYQGLLQLVRQSGLISSIYAYPIHEQDEWDWTLGDTPGIMHRPAKTYPRGEMIAVYARALVKGDDVPLVELMHREEVEAIRERSRAKGGPWRTDFTEMARKTVLRRICKYLPQGEHFSDFIQREDDLEFNGGPAASLPDPERLALEQTSGEGAPKPKPPIRRHRTRPTLMHGQKVKTHGVSGETAEAVEQALLNHPHGSSIGKDFADGLNLTKNHVTFLTEPEAKALLSRLAAPPAADEPPPDELPPSFDGPPVQDAEVAPEQPPEAQNGDPGDVPPDPAPNPWDEGQDPPPPAQGDAGGAQTVLLGRIDASEGQILCPNADGEVPLEKCEGCVTREGCPAWDEVPAT